MNIAFTIPGNPLSVNAVWRNTAVRGKPRTLLSSEGRTYKERVMYLAKLARKGAPPLTGPVEVRIIAFFESRRPDLDNVSKAILDAMADAGVYENDRQVSYLEMHKRLDPENPRAVVAVWPSEVKP